MRQLSFRSSLVSFYEKNLLNEEEPLPSIAQDEQQPKTEELKKEDFESLGLKIGNLTLGKSDMVKSTNNRTSLQTNQNNQKLKFTNTDRKHATQSNFRIDQ